MLKRLGLLWLSLAPALCAQTSAPAPPLHYEVVSIHASMADPDADTAAYHGRLHSSHVDIVGFSDLNLLVSAFNIQFFQIEFPKALPFATYDLHLSSGADTDAALRAMTDEQAQQAQASMLQEVLADRFHLRYHLAQREMKAHALTLATPGKLHPSTAPSSSAQIPPASGPSAEPSLQWNCTSLRCAIQARGESLDWLADRLSVSLHAPVVNQTGLHGLYNFDLQWELQAPTTSTPDNDAYPPLNVALLQQLGLHLTDTRAPTRILIVDHIEPPTPN